MKCASSFMTEILANTNTIFEQHPIFLFFFQLGQEILNWKDGNWKTGESSGFRASPAETHEIPTVVCQKEGKASTQTWKPLPFHDFGKKAMAKGIEVAEDHIHGTSPTYRCSAIECVTINR